VADQPTAETATDNTKLMTPQRTKQTIMANIPGIKPNNVSADYQFVLADRQRRVQHPSTDTTARTWTIPANSVVAFEDGDVLTVVNKNGAGTLTITINNDTLRMAGSGATGNRTLAPNGIATMLKTDPTEWMISGTGLT
jgi:hypothetical protein